MVKGIFVTFAGWCKSLNCNKEMIVMLSKKIQVLFPLFFTKTFMSVADEWRSSFYSSYSQSNKLLQSELSFAFGWDT